MKRTRRFMENATIPTAMDTTTKVSQGSFTILWHATCEICVLQSCIFLSTAEITVRGKVSTGTLHTSIITQPTTGSKCVGGSYLKSIESVWIGGEKEEICWNPYTSDPTYVPPTDWSCHRYGHEPDWLEKVHWGEIICTSEVLRRVHTTR